jgi:glutathione S-transferase
MRSKYRAHWKPHSDPFGSRTLTPSFISITQARAAPGLRIACLRGVPSPWTEAAKGIFHVKGIACQYAAQAQDDPDGALVHWAGDVGIPVVAYENEKLRTGWAEILLLAERLRPEPALIPAEAEGRATMFGLAHEICGEMGFGWAYRLVMIQQSLGHGGETSFPPDVASYLAPRYGFIPAHVRVAKARVIDVLRMFSKRIEGRRYLLGSTLTALDIYWATFANLILPLPEAELPAAPMIRAAYTCRDADILGAVSDELRALQRRVYDDHLELPVPL